MITPFFILVILALLFAVLALIPKTAGWPLVPIATIFLAVALMIGSK